MSLLFPRKHPSLPQDDSAIEQAKRKHQLAHSRLSYQWDNQNPNVGPVPMALAVPKEATPTLTWSVKVISVLLPIVENLIANVKDEIRLIEIQSNYDEITQALKTVRAGEHWSMLSHTSHTLKDLVNLFQDLVKRELQQDATQEQQELGLQAYRNQFKTLDLPSVADVFTQNESFARYRIAGPNPMLIKRLNEPMINFPLSEADFKQVMGVDDSLAQALKDKRLYIVDYKELSVLVDHPQAVDKRVFAPIALFAVAKTGSELCPVAIQMGQDPEQSPCVLAALDTQDVAAFWQWQAAMSTVQVADGNYHELFVHLGRTHLLIEAFALATERELAQNHPLNILLTPHFEGTLFINNSAAGSLIAKGGPIESIFGAEITATQKAAAIDRLALDFYASMLPNDLAARGVADKDYLPDYPYRDDAQLVWEAITAWCTHYIEVYYSDDAAVLNDYELDKWVAAVAIQGAVTGFKAIESREQLAKVLTMIIFTASAQHAAVNFPQKPLMSFAPALTGANWCEKPESITSQAQWIENMAPLKKSLQQLSLLEILGGVYYRQLGEYKSNNFPYFEWFEDKNIIQSGGPLAKFTSSLASIETTIDARNQHRPEYNFLLPSNIPMSINI
ncbi:Arachidonate 15-lipoxygenase [Shewanella denitrificans OS217]|jgi:arachidonate 15-lipoxygenase|uniref:Arachidonate 15-lipoxygenase n=1 Tax=Shewanella denitrificans (strain OS217 / ATCC BAA-1090 / DSM 15013) TaxID=318161 RepID=Q12NL2_SHEDO|nr:lipoxygenase family protein [Shewanella denitrificans]ABE54964.1 Arachidonate 15-lipoxygenase [Shewanella denitrificans OS217]